MKKIFFWPAIWVGLLLGWNVASAEEQGPGEMLQSLASQMITNLKANKASLRTNPNIVYALAYKIVVPHADLNAMSQRALPPAIWNQATPTQKTQFQKEFTTLLVHTYASALSDYTDQTIRFFPVRGGTQAKKNVRVDSQILRSDGPSISVSYQLVKRGNQWKLYDMTVEGVSLLSSFRSQFADKLSQGNMAALIRDLAEHNRSGQ